MQIIGEKGSPGSCLVVEASGFTARGRTVDFAGGRLAVAGS